MLTKRHRIYKAKYVDDEPKNSTDKDRKLRPESPAAPAEPKDKQKGRARARSIWGRKKEKPEK